MDDKDRPDEVERRSVLAARPSSGLARWIVGILLIGRGRIVAAVVLARPSGLAFPAADGAP